ncbi:MAG: BlaI/MecI/CopY family transcriptional regulator [Candidatus Jordarchaeum sp.]|uniref:BlaI/MecI/CopY family transcriptional regulator n=1 Tax=Candidatus Jordarchaeum sp. TaxID=2823881 RepID=UPI00404B8452
MVDKPKVYEFKPHEKDLSKVLGDLESEVMDTLWKLQKASVRDIHEDIKSRRSLAFNTVATILDRLYKKKFVERELIREKGIYYVYSPALTRKEFEKLVAKHVLGGLFESFEDSTIMFLLENLNINNPEMLEEIKKQLKKIKSKGESKT